MNTESNSRDENKRHYHKPAMMRYQKPTLVKYAKPKNRITASPAVTSPTTP